jgi:chemotaxis signal transduction protein
MEFLTFHVGDREFAVDMGRVQEIVAPPPISRVPDMPPALLGLAGLRGEPTAVVDAGLRLDDRRITITGRTPLLVLTVRQEERSFNVGLLVEAAGRKLELTTLLPWTEGLARFAGADACSGFADVDDGIVIVLDVDQLLDFAKVRAAGARAAPARLPAPAVPGALEATSAAASSRTPPAAPSSTALPSAVEPSPSHPSRSGSSAAPGSERPASLALGSPSARPEPSSPSRAEATAAFRATPPLAAARSIAPHATPRRAARPSATPLRRPVTPPGDEAAPVPPPAPPSPHFAAASHAAASSATRPDGADPYVRLEPTSRPALGHVEDALAPEPFAPVSAPAVRFDPAPTARGGGATRWVVAAALALILLAVVLFASLGGGDAPAKRGPSTPGLSSAPRAGGADGRASGRVEEATRPAVVASPPVERSAPVQATRPPEPSIVTPTPASPVAAVSPPPAPPRQVAAVTPAPRPTPAPSVPVARPVRTARPLPPSMVVTPDTPACEIHEVVRGDTLWWIAARRLGSPYKWPKLFGENRDRLADPNVIEVHDRIRVPGGCEPTTSR